MLGLCRQGSCWEHVWSMLTLCRPCVGPMLAHVGPILGPWWGMLGHVGPMSGSCYVGPMLGPCWAHFQHVEPKFGNSPAFWPFQKSRKTQDSRAIKGPPNSHQPRPKLNSYWNCNCFWLININAGAQERLSTFGAGRFHSVIGLVIAKTRRLLKAHPDATRRACVLFCTCRR